MGRGRLRDREGAEKGLRGKGSVNLKAQVARKDEKAVTE